MTANFLHGVETVEIEKGPRPIKMVKTAIIGLVGTAPLHLVDVGNRKINENVLILNDRTAAQYFGQQKTGYTIPQALDAIFDQGNGCAIVVNVFDPAVHKTAVTNEEKTFGTDDTLQLAHEGVINLVVKNSAGEVTYTITTDYTYDPKTGKVTRVSGGAITAGQTVKNSYDYGDPTKVTASDIIGEVDESGNRTGMQAFKDCYNELGFFPKILIAPGFCTQNSVATEMNVMAGKIRAISIIDAPIGTAYQDAITGRGPEGEINFNYSSERMILCYPHLKVYDSNTDADRLEPFSQRLAGIMAAKDIEKGYWWSPSNTEIKGITGIERKLSAMINDPNSEVNLLNESGITTIFNSYGTGFRSWGNRTAAWPSVTHPKNFINIRRTADIIHESIEYSMLQLIDFPINDALIDSVCESVNAFIRTLIGRGALIDGKCSYDPSKNSETEIALGHLVFDLEFMPPTPFERCTFESFINIELLKKLGGRK